MSIVPASALGILSILFILIILDFASFVLSNVVYLNFSIWTLYSSSSLLWAISSFTLSGYYTARYTYKLLNIDKLMCPSLTLPAFKVLNNLFDSSGVNNAGTSLNWVMNVFYPFHSINSDISTFESSFALFLRIAA